MTKRSRIVKHGAGYVAKRVFGYETAMGRNSAGMEVKYANEEEAKKGEASWLREA